MGTVYFPLDHTPEEWREKARGNRRREQESFERSDTDGYLSQWALTVTAQLYDTLAKVAEAGGMWDFRVLADAEGKPIEGAREYKTRWGYGWRLPNGSWFNPSQAQDEDRRRMNDLKKGFQFVIVQRPAVVVMSEGGMWGCHPEVIPRRTK